MPSNLSQPGIGDPYWFEWYVGLDYVISLLVGTYGIDSVTFQEAGLEGVDDVVVRRANGLPMVCVQAKHEKVSTSSTDNLTFSSLIRERKTLNGAKPKKSLLASLAAGWKQVINTEEASPEIVLYTNRELGINNTKAEYRSTEYNRLPLGEFWTTVSEKMETATLLADISFDDQDLSTQWCEFADSTKLDKDDIVPFLKSLRIEAGAPSLNAQEQRLTDRLRDEVCAGSQELASAVFRSLAAELRRWTTAAGDNVVTANIVVKCVCALNQNPLAKPIDVSLPNPIFPSRERACSSLCEKLAASDSKVVFLQGRPGVGKTRLVSCLCEQIIPNPVRFYSFKPLDTDDFSYSPDAGTVSSKELWSTLLNQLRDALELSDVKPQIPILNDLCSDDQLREEALRLAEVLSCRRGSKTILVIDGIDHAARAREKLTFLKHLPIPSSIPDGVLLLVVGQPANLYSSYPQWLKREHVGVEVIDVPNLDIEDISFLLRYKTSFSEHEVLVLANEVFGMTKGNTLSVVYAVHAIAGETDCGSAVEKLRSSGLSDNMEEYYESLWFKVNEEIQRQHGPGSNALDLLAASMHLLDGAVYPKLLCRAFPEVFSQEYVAKQDIAILEPLMRICADGSSRPLHNDFRLFVSSKARRAGMEDCVRLASSRLADAVLKMDGDVVRSCYSVRLLACSGRIQECIRLFDTSYIIDAVAQGVPWQLLREQAKTVYMLACESGELESVFRVQLALSTLSQVNEHFDYQLERRPFLHFEGLVGMDYLTPPFEAQTVPLYTMTLDRCLWLIESVGCEDEGFELYDAWFSSLTPLKAAEILSGPDGDSYHRQQEDGSSMLMDAWGELAAARGLDCEDITAGSGSTSGSRELLSRFWDAYVRGSLRWCPPSEDLGLRISDISISEEAASDMMGDVLSGALPASRAGRCTFFSRLSIHAFKRSLGTLAYVLCLSEGLSVPDIERGEPLLSQRVGGFYGKEFALGLFAESYVFGYETDCDDFASVICAMEASISWVDSSKREFLSIVRTLRAAACLGYSMAHREAILPGTPEALVLEEWTESRSWSGVLTIASCAMTYMSLVTEDGAALCGRALDTEDLESFVASARPLCEKLRVLEHFRKTNDDALKRFLSRTYGPDGSILLTSQEAKEVHELLRPLLSHCDQGLAERCDNAILSGSAGFTDHKDYSLSNLVELFDRLTELGLATEIQACSLLEIDSAATLSGDNRMSGELVESVASWAVARGPSQLSRIRSCRPEYKYDYALVEHQLISLLKTSGCLDDVIAVFAGLFGHTPCYSTGDIKSLRAHLDCCKCRAAELCCEKDFLSTVSDIENAISDAPKCELMKPELKRNDAEASLCCNALTDDELRNVAFAREVTHWQWEPVTEACSEMRERSWDKHEIYNQLAETRGRTLSKEGWVHSSSSVTKLIDDIARYAGDSSFFKMLSYRNEDLDRYGFSSASVDIAHALMVRAREKCPAFLVTMFELESDSKRKWVSCNGRCELPAVEPEASNLSAPESLAELVTDMLLDSVVPQDPHRTEDAVRGITWGGIRLAGMRSRTCEALPGLDPYGRMLLEKVLDCWLHKDPEDSVIANCLVGLIDVVERADEALLLSIIIEAPGLILKPDVGEPKSIGDENSEVPSRIERFLMDAQMLCNDECGDIRAAIKSSYQGEKGLCIKQYMRADEVSLPIFQIDDYCQELLYFEMCRGRWKEIPAAYAASLLIDPADVWVFSRIPVFKDSAEMGVSEAIRLFESGDTHIALDHVNGLPMHGLHQGEACLGWKIYIPYGNQDQYEFYSNARIAPLEQYDPDNVVDGEFGCYGVLARVDGGEASRFSTNSVSLCNAVAGCLTMTFCDCQIFPAFAMREFGFEPLVNNPLVWIDGLGNRVAWFERYVFPVERDYHSSAYYRQPQLWRWVCDVELVKKVVLARGFRVYWATEVNSHVDQIKERYDTQEALKKKSPFDKSVL